MQQTNRTVTSSDMSRSEVKGKLCASHNTEANRSQKRGGCSVLVLSQPLPHNLKGVLGNIIYKKIV
jgi:hypothetical protein